MADIPCRNSPYYVAYTRTWIFEPSVYLSGCEIEWWACVVAYSCDELLASCAILAGISIPPIPWPTAYPVIGMKRAITMESFWYSKHFLQMRLDFCLWWLPESSVATIKCTTVGCNKLVHQLLSTCIWAKGWAQQVYPAKMQFVPSKLSIYCFKTVDKWQTASRTGFKQDKIFRIVQFFKFFWGWLGVM